METKTQQKPKNAILDNPYFGIYIDAVARSLFMLIIMLLIIALISTFYPAFKGIVLFLFAFFFSILISPHLRFISVSPLIINKLRKYLYEK